MSWQCFLSKGQDISDEHLKNAWDKNTDGGGFAWAKGGVLSISKGFFKFEDFLTTFRTVGIDCNRSIMFRWGSFGSSKNEENCQPFRVNDGLCFTQSGTLSHVHSKGGFCDTYIYCEEYLKPLFKEDYSRVHREEIKWFLTESSGTTNKFVFLTKTGKGVIINANKGVWDKEKKGVWYSNDEHEKPKYVFAGNTGTTHTNNTHSNNDDYYKRYGHQANPPTVINNGPLKPEESYPVWLRSCFDEAIKDRNKALAI